MLDRNWNSPLAQFVAIGNLSEGSITKIVFSGELNGVMYASQDNYHDSSLLAHHDLNRETLMVVDYANGLVTRNTSGYNRGSSFPAYDVQDVYMVVDQYFDRNSVTALNQDWNRLDSSHSHGQYGMLTSGAGFLAWGDKPNKDAAGRFISNNKRISFEQNNEVMAYCDEWCSSRGLTLDVDYGFGNSYTKLDAPLSGGVTLCRTRNNVYLTFKVIENIPSISETAMAVTYSSQAKTFAVFGDESTAAVDASFNDLARYKIVTREPQYPRDDVEFLHPLTGFWGLVDRIEGRITNGSEEVQGGYLDGGVSYTRTLRTINIEVDRFFGIISRDDMVSYNTDCFGVKASNKEMKLSSFWDNFPFVEFARCPLPTFDSRTINVLDLKIAQDYNRARRKACKSENFLETNYGFGYTWGQIQDRIKQINHNSQIWLSELGSNGLVDWFSEVTNSDQVNMTCYKEGDTHYISVGSESWNGIINDVLPVQGSTEFLALEDFLINMATSLWVSDSDSLNTLNDAVILINMRLAEEDHLIILSSNTAIDEDDVGVGLDGAMRGLRSSTRSQMGGNFESGPLLPYSGKALTGDPVIMLASRQVSSFQHAGNGIKALLSQLISQPFLRAMSAEQRRLVESAP